MSVFIRTITVAYHQLSSLARAGMSVAKVQALVVLVFAYHEQHGNEADQHQYKDAHVDPKVVLNPFHR